MIRRSAVRYVLCSSGQRRRRPARCCLLLTSCGIFAATAAVLLLGTFYWNFWSVPTSWATKNSGEDTLSSTETTLGTDAQQQAIQRYRRPSTLRCESAHNLNPSYFRYSKYCAWNKNLQDCYQKFLQNEQMRQASSWVFLGGQDMSVLTEYVSRTWPYKDQVTQVTTRRNPCQNLLYYGLPPPSDGWKSPNASLGEGPTGYGLKHSYCSDCRTCWNVLMDASPPAASQQLSSEVSTAPTLPQRYLEYLVVEYSRDVTIQTIGTNTTQDTVSYHLRWKRPQVCVVSVGLFDAVIGPPVSEFVLLKNVERYLQLLHRACGRVVWLSIPAVVEDASIPHYDNCQLQKWNVAIMNMLTEKNYSNVYVLDIWDKSLETDHSSFLQLSNRFYASLSRLFVAVMMGHADSDDPNDIRGIGSDSNH